MERRAGWYEHPEYYEAIFGADSAREVDFLEQVSARYGTGGARWLEPACGSGRLLAEGARRGLRLAGYDVSRAMLEHARRRLRGSGRRRVTLYRARMEAFCPPALAGRFDLAFNLVSTFRYLSSEGAALSHLQCTRRLLKAGGLYVVGLHVTDYGRTHVERERWVGEVAGRRVVCNTREWPPDARRRRSRMRNRLRVTGRSEDLLIETEWFFRTYDGPQIQRLVRRAGFQLVALYDFDYRIDEPSGVSTDRLDWVLVLRPRLRPSAATSASAAPPRPPGPALQP